LGNAVRLGSTHRSFHLTDGTLDIVNAIRLPRAASLMACRYRGISGKESAVRAIFEAAVMLGATSVAMTDSDLRSITHSRIRLLISPTTRQVGLVAPRYERHKYDGFSAGLVETLLASRLWETPFVPRFGIDIFITSTALAHGFAVEEADLGARIHDSKDPALQLASMFRGAAGSALLCMEEYEESWKRVTSSFPVPIQRNSVSRTKPPPVHASLSRLIEEARTAYSRSEYFKSAISVGVRHQR